MYLYNLIGHKSPTWLMHPQKNINNIVKNPNWWEADQLAIYKDDRGVEPGTYPEQHQVVAKAGFEPGSPH